MAHPSIPLTAQGYYRDREFNHNKSLLAGHPYFAFKLEAPAFLVSPRPPSNLSSDLPVQTRKLQTVAFSATVQLQLPAARQLVLHNSESKISFIFQNCENIKGMIKYKSVKKKRYITI
ncbi:hypothetical protein XENTR_v10000547 [Xenopus tropicalis]|nr:hypothetical protein XENTR_v10000547 [Xenopus tropicalis]